MSGITIDRAKSPALRYIPEAYSSSGAQGQLWGRQSAGGGFLRALADTRPDRVLCLTHPPGAADDLRAALARDGSPDTEVRWIGLHDLNALAEPGLLYSPAPMVGEEAWLRSAAVPADAWSICGVVHTISGHSAMSAIAGWLTAPLQPWDAVICTSESVRDAVLRVLAAQGEFLAERLGAMRASPPRLPVIPLGVHPADFAFRPGERAAARTALGLASDEVAALFVGRLSPFNKAHPAPMYLAVEACAAALPAGAPSLVLIEAGWFENDEDRDAYAADAVALCPSVRRILLDGRDADTRRRAWAAADFFTSLSDSIQESFGLTPVEAMAAGLPAVVSDWNGYRDTVRDGIDGFRIPTWTLPPGSGHMVADRYADQIDDYRGFLATVGCAVAVDVAATAVAYGRLVADPDLRRRMGEAGRTRAAAAFDWRTIFSRYQALWAELAEARRAAAGAPLPRLRQRPDRLDPFTMFADYPTATLGGRTLLRRLPGIDLRTALERKDLATMRLARPLLPDPDIVGRTLEALADGGWLSFGELCGRLERHVIELAPPVLWLAKVGVLQLRPPERDTRP